MLARHLSPEMKQERVKGDTWGWGGDERAGEHSGVGVGRNWVRGNWMVITQEARTRLQIET